MKKVMVFGTFDILHPGHLNFFKQAREYGDYLIVVVAKNKTVEQIKRIIPHNNEKIRLSKVKKYADKAVLGMIKDKHKVIKIYKPDVICLGYDQKKFTDKLKKLKIPIKILKPYKPHIHKSSILRKKIKKQ